MLTATVVAVALLSAALIEPARAQDTSPQPPRLSISMPAGASADYLLIIEGEPDQDYVLEASTDHETWVSISTNRTGSGGTVQVTDAPADRFSVRFYRAFLQGSTNAPPTDIVWVDDFVPGGAVTRADGGDNSDWQWVTNNPVPYSGTRAHQSSLANGDHWHLFVAATETLRVDAGDVLFTYIYLHPDHVPSAILVEWTDGNNWEHRAYWGAHKFFYGTEGTASRRFMGPLPAAGEWVRLEIPASLVNLEGGTLSGMGFELFDGQATWDYAGKVAGSNAPPTRPIVTVTASDAAAGETGDPGTFTIARTGNTSSALTVNYTLGGTAQNGIDYQQLESAVTIPVGSSSAAVTVTSIDDTATEGNETVVLTLVGDAAYQISAGAGAGSATVTIADNEQPPETVWVDDFVPAGAIIGGDGGDNRQWEWVTNNPAPYSGTRAHQSTNTSGDHYHFFVAATDKMSVAAGDVLFTYIYLNPEHVPGAILLEWYDGNGWEHRAYWGANRFFYGTNGTGSRRSMGPLPAAGEWVRLEVPASLVDLEGRTVSGMVFELWDGQATWDYSGKIAGSNAPPTRPIVTVTASDPAAGETGDPGTFTIARTGVTTSALTVNYSIGGTAQSGVDYQQLESAVTIPVGSSSAAVTVTPIDDTDTEGNETVVLTLVGDAAYQISAGAGAGSATVTIADNEQPPETVWVDDFVPAGAIIGADGGDNRQWEWVTNNPTPYSGTRAHQSTNTNGDHYHFFVAATDKLSVAAGDVLFTYIYLNPEHVPGAILLEWYDGNGWEHRAYWGANRFFYGTDGTASRRSMGPLPAAGEWVRLEVPASLVDLEGRTVSGMVFELWDGQATWDYSGKMAGSNAPPTRPIVTVTASDAAAGETGDAGTFTIARTGVTTSALTVNYSIGGTAQTGVDYQPLENSVTIPAGSSSAAVTVTPIDDTDTEGNETVVLTLVEDAAYQISAGAGAGSATLTIADNEQPPETVWMDDFVPAGAVTRADGGDNPDWQWVTNSPAPYSGTRAHQSTNAAGDHWHLFVAATQTLRVDAGDVLFTYIYIDPDHVPSAILVEWTDGNNWEHRAYWGAQKFFYGTEGTASRRYMGPLPPAGQWVRLEIPASLVDLEDRTLSGMGFELFDGQATWDYSGKIAGSNAPPTRPIVTVTASDAAAAETGPDKGTFTIARTGNTSSALTVNYTLGGTAQTGVDYQPLENSVTIPAGSSSATVSVTPIDDTDTEGNETVVLTLVEDAAYQISAGAGSATVTIADNEQPPETVWVDDFVPGGAVTRADGGDNPDWQWVTNNPAPYSGTRAHQSTNAAGDHWHLFVAATQTLRVDAGDVLFTYIYIDPDHVPSAILLEWTEGNSWEHRAYWGAQKFFYGTEGTASRRYMGPLPPAGQWVRLEIPASLVDLENRTLSGMGFELFDGQATWDYSGKSPAPPLPTVSVVASVPLAAELGPLDGEFTISRSHGTNSALTVRFILGGTASNGTDYELMESIVTIPAGATSVTVLVRPIQDADIELVETVVLTLAEDPAYTIGLLGTATVTIADDDLLLFP